MESRGQINCYTCEKCHKMHFTINLVDGVTPFMSKCRACGKMAQSACYRLPVVSGMPLVVEYAWYRPKPAAWAKMEQDLWRQHFLQGGMMLGTLAEAVENCLDVDLGKDNIEIIHTLEAYYCK